MATKIVQHQCDNCEIGIVNLVIKETKNTTDMTVKNCNNCKKSFGFKSISKLAIIKTPLNEKI